MNLPEALRQYLDESGESMRSLSLRAGVNKKAVSDILNLSGLKPRHKTLVALSTATGLDLHACVETPRARYADLLRHLDQNGHTTEASRVRWLLRQTGWVAQLEDVCKHEVADFFAQHNANTFGLTPGSLATYKSQIFRAIGRLAHRRRPRSIADIDGIYAELHTAIRDSKLPKARKLIAGSFLVYLHDRGVMPPQVTTEILAEYYVHRLEVSSKGEEVCRKHLGEITGLVATLAAHPDFQTYGFAATPSPLKDGRDRFGVPDSAIATLMHEFDTRVAPWAQGRMSRDGLSRKEFVKSLDRAEEPVSDKKAALRSRLAEKRKLPGEAKKSRKSVRDDVLEQHGFLTAKNRWSDRTLLNRRGGIVALAKAIVASIEVVPDSMEELTDPEFLEAAAEALSDANSGNEFGSGYLETLLKAVRKIARFYVCRPPEEIKQISATVDDYKCRHEGIAPRNRAKLQEFTKERIQATIDLTDTLVAEINAELARRRKRYRKKHGVLPALKEVVDLELARDVMAALAHDIMLVRAPRSANLIGIRLDWIAYQGSRARITVPAAVVKGREANDPDLPIPLGEQTSRQLRLYIEQIRPLALQSGDEQNPFLFPGQDHRSFRPNRPYTGILKRVVRQLKAKVGVGIHPHLYRHLVGWIWLKESLDNLPKVQKLLGHKSLQTTIRYYAEIDETLALEEWSKHLNRDRGGHGHTDTAGQQAPQARTGSRKQAS